MGWVPARLSWSGSLGFPQPPWRLQCLPKPQQWGVSLLNKKYFVYWAPWLSGDLPSPQGIKYSDSHFFLFAFAFPFSCWIPFSFCRCLWPKTLGACCPYPDHFSHHTAVVTITTVCVCSGVNIAGFYLEIASILSMGNARHMNQESLRITLHLIW